MPEANATQTESCLKIVSVNDVYALDNLPRLKTLVLHHASTAQAAARKTTMIVVLAGDFLAPSLLSSIDAGRGMVDCLNEVGITHFVLGNHEDDIPIEELRKRLAELRGVCLGTNIRSGFDGLLPAHARIDVDNGKHKLAVGIVGVVMVDAMVYRGKPFGGASVVRANDGAMELATSLISSGECKDVVAITHQSIADDRLLARMMPGGKRFAVIIGGHEHTPFLEHIDNQTWIVKAGSEATHAAITEIVWSSSSSSGDPSATTVTTRLEDVSQYPEDAALRARVDMHMGRVRELATATLLYIPPGSPPLSSVGSRARQTSIGTLICTKLREALEADACLFNGGGIRAARDYPERFTYGDVEAEVPFDNEVVVVNMTGRIVRDAVVASRAKAPLESGSFLQVDDRMVIDPTSHQVTMINDAPIDLDREYKVGVVRELLLGLDRVEPLTQWAKDHTESVPPAGSGREPKTVLVQAFARAIWQELGGFDALDLDRDNRVTAQEIADAVAKKHPSQMPSPVLADLVIRAVDANADQVITRHDAIKNDDSGDGSD